MKKTSSFTSKKVSSSKEELNRALLDVHQSAWPSVSIYCLSVVAGARQREDCAGNKQNCSVYLRNMKMLCAPCLLMDVCTFQIK